MNREEALRKAVEIAPTGAESGDVLAYADWLLTEVVETRVEFVPESYDPLADAKVGAVGLDSANGVWLKEADERWSVFSGENGTMTRYWRDSNARYCDVSIVGEVRPSEPDPVEVPSWLVGSAVSLEDISEYPVGLLAIDDDMDLWVYVGWGVWDCYYSDGSFDTSYYDVQDAVDENAVIIGGIRGQA